MKPIKNYQIYILYFICILLFFLIGSVNRKIELNKKAEIEYMDTISTQIEDIKVCVEDLYSLIGKYYIEKGNSLEFSEANLYHLLKMCNVYYPEIIVAQYKIETGNGTSQVFKENNNLFGMKKAFSRRTCRNYTESKNGYAKYYNWQLSAIDRVLWDFTHFKTKPAKGDYYKAISNIYAEDGGYIEKLMIIERQIKKKYN